MKTNIKNPVNLAVNFVKLVLTVLFIVHHALKQSKIVLQMNLNKFVIAKLECMKIQIKYANLVIMSVKLVFKTLTTALNVMVILFQEFRPQ